MNFIWGYCKSAIPLAHLELLFVIIQLHSAIKHVFAGQKISLI
jgi:hypothetical protein